MIGQHSTSKIKIYQRKCRLCLRWHLRLRHQFGLDENEGWATPSSTCCCGILKYIALQTSHAMQSYDLYYFIYISMTLLYWHLCTEAANREARQAHYPIPNNFQRSILDLCVRICSCPHACLFHLISNTRSLNFMECVKNCKAKSWNTKSGRRVKCLCYAVFFLISSNRSSIWIWFYLLILILYYFIY